MAQNPVFKEALPSPDETIQGIFNHIAELSEDQTGYADDLEIVISAIADGMGYTVSILSDGDRLVHAAAETVADALWMCDNRLVNALEKAAREMAEAEELDD